MTCAMGTPRPTRPSSLRAASHTRSTRVLPLLKLCSAASRSFGLSLSDRLPSSAVTPSPCSRYSTSSHRLRVEHTTSVRPGDERTSVPSAACLPCSSAKTARCETSSFEHAAIRESGGPTVTLTTSARCSSGNSLRSEGVRLAQHSSIWRSCTTPSWPRQVRWCGVARRGRESRAAGATGGTGLGPHLEEEPAQLWLEAGVEERVEPEQREQLDVAERQPVALHEVDQPAGRRHEQLDARRQLGLGLLESDPAAGESAAQRRLAHQPARLAHRLHRGLAGRHQHERPQPATGRSGRLVGELAGHGQQQGRSLALGRRADHDEVATGERDRHDVLLQRRRPVLLGEAQVVEELRRELGQLGRLKRGDRHVEREVGALHLNGHSGGGKPRLCGVSVSGGWQRKGRIAATRPYDGACVHRFKHETACERSTFSDV